MKKPKYFIPKDRSVDNGIPGLDTAKNPTFKPRKYYEEVQPCRGVSKKAKKLKTVYTSPISEFDERDVGNYTSFDLYKTYTYNSVNIEASSDGSVKIGKTTDESS